MLLDGIGVVPREFLGLADVEDPIRIDEDALLDLVEANKQTKPRQQAKTQEIHFQRSMIVHLTIPANGRTPFRLAEC